MKSFNVTQKVLVLIIVSFSCRLTVKSQETLYPFQDKGKYGYINKSGKVEIAEQFDFAEKFCEGMAVVKKDGKRGF